MHTPDSGPFMIEKAEAGSKVWKRNSFVYKSVSGESAPEDQSVVKTCKNLCNKICNKSFSHVTCLMQMSAWFSLNPFQTRYIFGR